MFEEDYGQNEQGNKEKEAAEYEPYQNRMYGRMHPEIGNENPGYHVKHNRGNPEEDNRSPYTHGFEFCIVQHYAILISRADRQWNGPVQNTLPGHQAFPGREAFGIPATACRSRVRH